MHGAHLLNACHRFYINSQPRTTARSESTLGRINLLAEMPRIMDTRQQCCSSFAQWKEGGYSFSLLSVLPQGRPLHYRWLAPLYGMGFLWHCDCSPGFFLPHSTLLSENCSTFIRARIGNA